MNQSLQQIFNNFIKEQGKTVVKKERTFKSFMADLLKDYPAERNISEQLSQLGILSKLASPATKSLGEGEIARYADELVKKFGVDKNKAIEVIRMWAVALGVHVPFQSSQPEPEDEDTEEDNTEEDNFFEKAKRENTIDSYSEYIDKYPDGKYVYEAAGKVNEFYKYASNAFDNRFGFLYFAIQLFLVPLFLAPKMSIEIDANLGAVGFFVPIFIMIIIAKGLDYIYDRPKIADINDVLKQIQKTKLYYNNIMSIAEFKWSIPLFIIIILLIDYIIYLIMS